MDDVELTKRCARAQGREVRGLASKAVCYDVSPCAIVASNAKGGDDVYDPLHDDAQAHALVKRFELTIVRTHDIDPKLPRSWYVRTLFDESVARGDDLNRCIVECVAAMPHGEKI